MILKSSWLIHHTLHVPDVCIVQHWSLILPLCTSATNVLSALGQLLHWQHYVLFLGRWLSAFWLHLVPFWIFPLYGFWVVKHLEVVYHCLLLLGTNKNQLESYCCCLWKIVRQCQFPLMLLTNNCPLRILSSANIIINSWRRWMPLSLISQLWLLCLWLPC